MNKWVVSIVLILTNFCFSLHAEETKALQPPAQEEVAQPPMESVIPPEFERPEPPQYEGTFLKVVLVLVVILVVIFFTMWLIRKLSLSRMHMFKEPKHIRIVDRRPLSQKTALYLIEVGDKRVLITESQLEVKRLMEIELKEISSKL